MSHRHLDLPPPFPRALHGRPRGAGAQDKSSEQGVANEGPEGGEEGEVPPGEVVAPSGEGAEASAPAEGGADAGAGADHCAGAAPPVAGARDDAGGMADAEDSQQDPAAEGASVGGLPEVQEGAPEADAQHAAVPGPGTHSLWFPR
jgi:hypothetical protein